MISITCVDSSTFKGAGYGLPAGASDGLLAGPLLGNVLVRLPGSGLENWLVGAVAGWEGARLGSCGGMAVGWVSRGGANRLGARARAPRRFVIVEVPVVVDVMVLVHVGERFSRAVEVPVAVVAEAGRAWANVAVRARSNAMAIIFSPDETGRSEAREGPCRGARRFLSAATVRNPVLEEPVA